MMKKLISLVLCAVLLMSCVPFASHAQAETQRDNGSAVDIVLLIDQSGSVWNGGTSGASDPNGLRLDAAQMVIAMLGMNGSRVAYVPFGSRVFANADTEFHEIRGIADYRNKMAECETLRNAPEGPNGENGGGTDFAEPLAYAYNLLANRGADETNQPMIILLTDGAMEFTKEAGSGIPRANKPYYIWSNATQRFEPASLDDNGRPRNVMVYSDKEHGGTYFTEDLLSAAKRACANAHYPVYTVALNADTTSAHYRTLNEISSETGAGNAIAISKSDASELAKLPEYFGDMFADRIGSSALVPLTVECVDPATNLYEVRFVIPNKSVMEANLFVSKEGISGYKLIDPDGNERDTNANDSSVMRLASENFILYKLNNPRPYGIWKLQFTKTDDRADKDISFNLLYNYDVVLRGFASRVNEYPREDDVLTFQRGDVLTFSARFFDTSEGRLSDDVTLYTYPDVPGDPTDDWCNMTATYELHQVTGTSDQRVVNGSGVMSAEGTQFSASLDMKTISMDNEGNNTLPAGEYFMLIRVTGCGLEREVKIPFTLVNTAPSSGLREIPLTREVNGADEATHVASRIEHDVSAFVLDVDDDKIASKFEPDSATADVITLDYDPATCTIYSYPVVLPDGKLNYGVARGKLTVWEVLTGETTVIDVVMTVTSGNNELYRKWELDITVGDGSGVQEKNTEVDIKLDLLLNDNNLRPDHNVDPNQVAARVEIMNTVTGAVVKGDMTMDEEHRFTYAYTTGAKKGEWEVTVYIDQVVDGGENVPIKYKTTNFTIENEAPKAQIATETHTIYHNPLPSFLSFLGEATSEEDRTIDLTGSAYFTDADNEELTYVTTQEPNANFLTIDRKENGVWVLSGVEGANGKTNFKVYAVDNDGEKTEEIIIEVELVDLVQLWAQRGLLALAALVALIILIMIVRQIRKPKFPKGAVLGVREGNSDYDTSTYEFMPGKKPISLAAVVMTDTAAKFGINANALTNIELVPVRSVNGSIGVRLKKRMDDVTVALTSKNVGKGKKPTVWAPGDSLILNSRSNAGADLNVILFPAEPTAVMGGGTMVDEDPFQVNDNSGFGGFNSDVNAFGANDVSGSFGGLAPTDNFGASAGSVDSGFSVSIPEDNNAGDGFTADNGSGDDFTIGF